MSKDNLHDFVFSYNVYTDTWGAAKRENYNELFSGEKGNVIRSSNINTLIELIMRTNGAKDKIEGLLKKKTVGSY